MGEKGKIKLEGLTVLRGAAAIWVALHHAFLSLEGTVMPEGQISHNLVLRGWLGVDLFFILSGFIISYSYLGRVSVFDASSSFDFLRRRFARIYPAHLFTLFLFALAVYAADILGVFHDPQGLYSVSKLMEQVLMLNGLGLFEPVGWNAPSWSISSEFLAYAFFPILALAVGRFKSAGGAALLIVAIIAPNVWLAYKINVGQQYMLGFEFVWVRVLSEFLIGMALFRLRENLKLGKFALPMIGLSCAGIIAHGMVENSFFDFFYLIYFCALIWGLSEIKFAKRIPGLSLLGEVSYSLYLCHSLVIMGLNQTIRNFYPNAPESLALSAFLGLSIAGGWAIYTFIEKPGQKLVLSGTEPSRVFIRRKLSKT